MARAKATNENSGRDSNPVLALPSADEWAQVLLGRNDPGETSAEIAEKIGMAPRTVRGKLRQMVEAGRIIKGVARRPNSCGCSVPVSVYLLKEQT